MEQTVSRFNLYDHLGYISVWFYTLALLALVLFFNNIFVFSIKDIGFWDWIFLLLACYIVWHIIQAVSNFIIKENKNSSDNSYDFIVEKVKKVFWLANETKIGMVFQYAYLSSVWKDPSWQIALFNSLYSFYRGLYTTTLLATIVFLWFIVYSWILCNTRLIMINTLWLLISCSLVYVFNQRKDRFYQYMWQKVWIIFDILNNEAKISHKQE